MTDADRAGAGRPANDDSFEPLEVRRKRLIYRSLYTGLKETDLLLGSFARAHVPHFSEDELGQYERLLDVNEDPRIYAWAIGREPVPEGFDTPVMRLLQNFRLAD